MKSATHRTRGAAIALASFAFVLNASPVFATIRYTISLDQPAQHMFHVEIEIPRAGPGTEIAMPAWNALYQVRDFAERIRNIQGTEVPRNTSLAVTQLDKQTWRVTGFHGDALNTDIRIAYQIQWDEPGPFNSQLDGHHAFLNFAEILMYVPNRRSEDTEVTFSNIPPAWRVAAQLTAAPDSNSFVASSYDNLVDSPVEIGQFEAFSFSVQQANFNVLVDSADWKKDRLEDYLRRITSYELGLMGGPPFKEYTFFFHIAPDADASGGGMEHSFSTAIAASTTEGAATIAAHEFFHAWNVKRIRPRALEPVDYTKEQPTRALWFAEGVTSTYAAYALVRTGLWSKDQFYSNLASQIQELDARPARKWQSVEESSLDAWFEKYDEYNQPDRSISYYNKGQIDGVLLDLSIRNATDNRKSLDDVLRRMYAEYAQQGKFYDESNGIRAAVEEVSGVHFDDFFGRYVVGTDEIPYDTFLGYAGLQLKAETEKSADVGFRFSLSGGTPQVVYVEPDNAAESAGLHVGDVIVAINGQDSAKNSSVLRESAPGDLIHLRVRRENAEREISFPTGTREHHLYSIVENARASAQQRQIREGLLRGTTD